MADQRILFAKYGTAKYISHLDLMHTMERAFLRAGITIRHTAGFHPHPYVSIPLPLPLFFSSQCELLEFGLVEGSTMEQLPEQINKVLPAGIEILDCYEGGLPFRKLAFSVMRSRWILMVMKIRTQKNHSWNWSAGNRSWCRKKARNPKKDLQKST